MTQRQQGVLCIDFGLDRLTVVEVGAEGVSGWFIRDLPPKVVRNGDPVEPGQVAELLAQGIRESGLSGVRARFTLPDEAAIVRLVELPALPRRHVHRALRFIVDKEVPLPLDRISWSWDVLERTDIGYRICLVAAWNDVIERITRVATDAGLQLERLEPRSLATARALDRDSVVVFDGGSARLQVTHLRRGQIPFVDHAAAGHDEVACARILERLWRRGTSAEDQLAGTDSVALAGDLEDLDLPLSMAALPVSRFLQPRLRRQVPELPAGSLLANLGLADDLLSGLRESRRGLVDINLLEAGGGPQPWVGRLRRLRTKASLRVAAMAHQHPLAGSTRRLGRPETRLAREEVQ